MVAALKEYASGDRPHPTMHAQAVTMTEQDMHDIAAYLSGQELKSTGRAVGTAPKAGQTCVACHGSDGVGILPEYPNLAGQHADYIEQALKAYRAGQRKNPIMGGMAAPLTDADIEALAQYYSGQLPGLCATNETRAAGKCPGT
jgi:cytochrome c553